LPIQEMPIGQNTLGEVFAPNFDGNGNLPHV
jgi:hypothetical protein